jgi:carboxyl-terminal processing protease
MLKKLETLIAMLLALTLCFSTAAYAGETQVPLDVDLELTPTPYEEKLEIAGDLISEVMKLIGDHYVGEDITTEMLYEAALRGMSQVLDPYSEYYSDEDLEKLEQSLSGSVYGIGIRLAADEEASNIVKYVLPDSPAEKSGLIPGDAIITVNGTDVQELEADGIAALITEAKEKALVVFRRGDALHTVEIPKEIISVSTVEVHKVDDAVDSAKGKNVSNMRYIRLTEFGENTSSEFKKALEQMSADGVTRIILDLRGNPGGYAHVTVDLCRMIVPKGPIMYTIDKKGTKKEINSSLEKPPFEKIALLTDPGTASAAEVLASALQDAGAAVVIGETTYGKGLIQSIFTLPSGGAFKLTTEKYLRRSGGEINGIGVIPDVPMSPPDIVTESVKLDKAGASELIPVVRSMAQRLGYSPVEPSNKNVYDASLKQAIMQFQKDQSIEANSELNDATIFALDKEVYSKYYKVDPPLQKAYETIAQ